MRFIKEYLTLLLAIMGAVATLAAAIFHWDEKIVFSATLLVASLVSLGFFWIRTRQDRKISQNTEAGEKVTTRTASARLNTIIALVVLAVLLGSSSFVYYQFLREPRKEYDVGSILWQQSSGEYRALCYQAFALARVLVDRDVSNQSVRMPRAVIVDVDETILDNSRHEAWLNKNNRDYNSKDWTEWCNRAEADAVPGAVEFLRYANSRGVRVFYITNRKDIEKEGTARNLKRLGLPEVNDETLLVRNEAVNSSKEPRRQSVAAKYRIVLLMGDDLNDFASMFEDSKTVDSRIAAADQFKDEFGKRFIVLPNPMYGNWESAIYGSNFKLSEAEKAEKRRSLLKSYGP